MQNWEKVYKKFVWKQHIKQLTTAITRYPNSPEASRRKIELDELNKKLEELEAE